MGPPIGVLPRKITPYKAITRPRISLEDVSCKVALPVMAKAMPTPPTSGMRTQATGRTGASPSAIDTAPRRMARVARRGVFG